MNSSILQIIQTHGESTPKELREMTGFSRQYLHRQLKMLHATGKVKKIGSSPMTYYQLADEPSKTQPIQLFDSLKKTISDHFVRVSVTGQLLQGLDAFQYWCKKNNLPLQETALAYDMVIKRHERFKTSYHCIDGTEFLKNTMGYGEVYLNQLLYLDFHELDKFGQTKLAHMLHFAKISQHQRLCHELIALVRPNIEKLIQRLNISAIAFIPPTEKREVQIMRLMEQHLSFNLPVIKLVKVNGDIAVPQKSLSQLKDRIENARGSIMPVEKRQFEKLLIIDDNVGSGATINETARKIRKRGIANQIFGLAITGSNKQFKSNPNSSI